MADHLLKDGSRLDGGVDVHKLDFKPGSMFMPGRLGLFWALIRLGILSEDVGSKFMVPTPSTQIAIPTFYDTSQPILLNRRDLTRLT